MGPSDTSPPSDPTGESQRQCRAKIRSAEESEEELDRETREGTENGGPPEEIGESRLTLSPVSWVQVRLTEAAREEGGGW